MSFRTAHMTDAQLALARASLLGPMGDSLIDWLVAINLYQAPPKVDAQAIHIARQLDWVDEAHQLSEVGRLATDSLREYRFWIQRGRSTHGDAHHPLTAKAAYGGRVVLEVGCGFGANLLSLQGSASKLVGVDPAMVYRQMAPILALREGREPLEIVDGLGEALPFPDASFDILLCYSSHQYMDVRRAFKDMARVIKPGGQLQLVSGQLDQFMSVMREQRAAGGGLGTLKHTLEVWLNTRSYQSLGRRLIGGGLLGTTAVPIYPQDHHLERWLVSAGLVFRRDLLRRVNSDTYVFADKPG